MYMECIWNLHGIWLAVCIPAPLKNTSLSVGMITPNILEKFKKNTKQPAWNEYGM